MDGDEKAGQSSPPWDSRTSIKSTGSGDLRDRIAELEAETRKMQEHRFHLERKLTQLESVPKTSHYDHEAFAKENERTFGKGGVIFIHPKDLHKHERLRVGRIIHRPVLHQWIQNGKVHRQATERHSSRFELFFDLLFIGIVHQIADAAAELPNGNGFARYILTFSPAYSIWSDVREIINEFATDDLPQRLYILWIMALLVGYSTNAALIEVGHEVVEGEIIPNTLTAVNWTAGFFLAAKMSKVLLLAVYGYYLPRSRFPLFTRSFHAIINSVLALVILFVPMHYKVIIVGLIIAIEYIWRPIGIGILKTLGFSGDQRPTNDSETTIVEPTCIDTMMGTMNHGWRIPAINIEHHVERLGAFVTITLGEMVISLLYKSSKSGGINRELGRGLLGLTIAFNLNWLYFDSEACRAFVHALRRHWFTGLIFTILHLPLCMALLLASSAIHKLVTNDDTESGIKYYFGSGVGIAVLCMGTIGLLHKRLDDVATTPCADASSVLIRKKRKRFTVLSTRFVMGLLMTLLPLAHDHYDSLQMLGIYTGITALLITGETLAKIEPEDDTMQEEWEK